MNRNGFNQTVALHFEHATAQGFFYEMHAAE